MKLRYIFTALAAAALAFVGCQQEEKFLDEVQVSQSLVTLDVQGGEASVTVTATAAVEGIESIQRILDIVSFDAFDRSLCTIAQFVPRLLRLGRRDGESNVLYAIVYAGERIGGDNAAHVTVCPDKRLEISLTFFHQFQASVREIGVFKRNHLRRRFLRERAAHSSDRTEKMRGKIF